MFDDGGTKSTIICCQLDADLEAVKAIACDYHYVHALLSSGRAKKCSWDGMRFWQGAGGERLPVRVRHCVCASWS